MLDRMIESQQELGFDSGERGEVIREIQRRLLGEAYMVTLGGGETLWVMQDAVEGFLSEYGAGGVFFLGEDVVGGWGNFVAVSFGLGFGGGVWWLARGRSSFDRLRMSGWRSRVHPHSNGLGKLGGLFVGREWEGSRAAPTQVGRG